jgi:hypothetical protein
MTRRGRVEIHVGELVMEGFSQADAMRVQAHMMRELEQMVARRPGGRPADAHVDRAASSFEATSPLNARAAGRSLATSIYRSAFGAVPPGGKGRGAK